MDQYALQQRTAQLSDLVLIRDDLPFDFWHGWKFVRFGPDGRLYIPIGGCARAALPRPTRNSAAADP